MVNKKGLGKGLDALFISAETENDNKKIMEKEILELKINDIEPNADQPRRSFNDEKLNILADSIKKHGVIQPIIVKKENDSYKIVAGERRWRAARIAGLKTIPVVIKDFTSKQVMEVALIENIQREDLNPIEEAEAYEKLIKEFNLTQEELSSTIGKSRPAIANCLRLLNLCEEVKSMLIHGIISSGHARTLVPIEEKSLQIKIAEDITKLDLSVRETEKYVKKYMNTKITAVKPKEKSVHVLELENQLKEVLGTKVEITSNENKGKISIEYYSKEEMERIIDIISIKG